MMDVDVECGCWMWMLDAVALLCVDLYEQQQSGQHAYIVDKMIWQIVQRAISVVWSQTVWRTSLISQREQWYFRLEYQDSFVFVAYCSHWVSDLAIEFSNKIEETKSTGSSKIDWKWCTKVMVEAGIIVTRGIVVWHIYPYRVDVTLVFIYLYIIQLLLIFASNLMIQQDIKYRVFKSASSSSIDMFSPHTPMNNIIHSRMLLAIITAHMSATSKPLCQPQIYTTLQTLTYLIQASVAP
jgi:hypothetical protein